MSEKMLFAERLRAAMTQAGYEPRPHVLEKQFNSRYWGKPVSYQATRHWLIGVSIPAQDKLQVLADWLGVEAHVLRYGSTSGSRRSGSQARWRAALTPLERDTIDTFLALSDERKRLVHELVLALGPVPGKAKR